MKRIFLLLLAMMLCLQPLSVCAHATNVSNCINEPVTKTRTIRADAPSATAVMDNGVMMVWGLVFLDGRVQTIATPTEYMRDVSSVLFFKAEVFGNSGAVIKTDGALWMWGDNSYYQLGNNTTTRSNEPVKVLDDVANACVNNDYTMAVTTDGTLWMWGSNSVLGTSTVPKKLMSDVREVATGTDYALVLKTDGTIWAWGDNSMGKLGDGTDMRRDEPVKVLSDAIRVIAGDSTSAAIKSDGTLWMWGRGIFDSEKNLGKSLAPIKIMDDIVDMSIASDAAWVLKSDGSAYVWGCTLYNPLSNDRPVNGYIIQRLQFDIPVATVSLSRKSSVLGMVLLTDGTVWTWGANSEGQLGNGEVVSKLFCRPTKILENVKVPSSDSKPKEDEPYVGKFTDVPSKQWYAVPVAWALEKQITNGTSQTTFSPDETCTRGQVITFLWRAAGSPRPSGTAVIADAGNTYYSDAIRWAAECNMFSGNTFSPNAPCTRAAVVEFMWKYAGSPSATPSGKFTDVPSNAPYATAVAWALERNVTNGTSQTTFSPDSTCTRGQIVTFLYRGFA